MDTIVEKLQARQTDLREWLSDNAPQCVEEQRHLDADSIERSYWHYGYAVAISDVLRLLVGDEAAKKH